MIKEERGNWLGGGSGHFTVAALRLGEEEKELPHAIPAASWDDAAAFPPSKRRSCTSSSRRPMVQKPISVISHACFPHCSYPKVMPFSGSEQQRELPM